MKKSFLKAAILCGTVLALLTGDIYAERNEMGADKHSESTYYHSLWGWGASRI